MCFSTKCEDKLRSAHGETITEVLVASLVIAFGSILLASMVVASTRIIKRSMEAYHLYTERHNAIEMLSVSGDSIKMGSFTVGIGNPATITDEDSITIGYLHSEKDKNVSISGKVYIYSQGSIKEDQVLNETIAENIKANLYTVSGPEKSSTEDKESDTNVKVFTRYFSNG